MLIGNGDGRSLCNVLIHVRVGNTHPPIRGHCLHEKIDGMQVGESGGGYTSALRLRDSQSKHDKAYRFQVQTASYTGHEPGVAVWHLLPTRAAVPNHETNMKRTRHLQAVRYNAQSILLQICPTYTINRQPLQEKTEKQQLRGRSQIAHTNLAHSDPASQSHSMLGDNFLQLGRIRVKSLIDLRAVLENQEGRHRTDAVFHRDFGEFVDVDFEVICLFVFFTELEELGGNGLAKLSTC
jgi:hypothetical protein